MKLRLPPVLLLALSCLLVPAWCGPALADLHAIQPINRAYIYQQKQVPVYTYKVTRTYPHDVTSYTEGLCLAGKVLYESTGRYGHSRLRAVELASGKVLRNHDLSPRQFGEGMTVLGERVFQLTYITNQGMIYDRNTLKLMKKYRYYTQGWGLTHDGQELIMSDGSAALRFIDPKTLAIKRMVLVSCPAGPVGWLNELEYVQGKVFANVWQSDIIAIIDPQNGKVTAWIDLTGLNPDPQRLKYPYVLNGIAHDPRSGRLLVTGKCWPHVWEIELVPARTTKASK